MSAEPATAVDASAGEPVADTPASPRASSDQPPRTSTSGDAAEQSTEPTPVTSTTTAAPTTAAQPTPAAPANSSSSAPSASTPQTSEFAHAALKKFKLVFLGEQSVGKTSLITRFM